MIEELMNGKKPIHRQNQQNGESEYYYVNPADDVSEATWFTKRETADVETADVPNPFLKEQKALLVPDVEYPADRNLISAQQNTKNTLTDDVLGAVTSFDDGYTFGFGRKLGGAINASGAAPVDALVTDKSFTEAFNDRYNEVVDTADTAQQQFEQQNPVEAASLELGGSLLNPLNSVAVKGTGLMTKRGLEKIVDPNRARQWVRENPFVKNTVDAGLAGTGTGALYTAGQAEDWNDFQNNVATDMALGGAGGVGMASAGAGLYKGINKVVPNFTTNWQKQTNRLAHETLQNITPQSVYHVGQNVSTPVAHQTLRNQADELGLNLYGDINHFSKYDRNNYARTLKHTLEHPDITYSDTPDTTLMQRDYFVKKYTDMDKGADFYDLVIKQKNDIFNKFNTSENYISNQLDNPIRNLTLHQSQSSSPTGGFGTATFEDMQAAARQNIDKITERNAM